MSMAKLYSTQPAQFPAQDARFTHRAALLCEHTLLDKISRRPAQARNFVVVAFHLRRGIARGMGPSWETLNVHGLSWTSRQRARMFLDKIPRRPAQARNSVVVAFHLHRGVARGTRRSWKTPNVRRFSRRSSLWSTWGLNLCSGWRLELHVNCAVLSACLQARTLHHPWDL